MESKLTLESLHIPRELVHVLIILALAWLLMRVSRRLIRLFTDYMNERADSAEDRRRIDTIAHVLHYIASVVIWLIAGIMALSVLGISVAPVLGAAGVVGIAVGFGAQSLIKDYFNGFFMLLENQIRQGDAVELCDKKGIVEDITLRFVALRDIEGNVHYIPNGQISIVTNKSRGYAYALINFGVAYREDLDEVYRVTRETAATLRADPEIGPMILEDIEIQGVQDWADSAVVIRCRFKTESLEQWNVRRAFLGRLKKAFDAHGIEIPYPHLTIYAGQDRQGNAPALRIARQNGNS
ncbi:MAG: mechanosensitive ion channel family protein [Nitrosomonadales bacterium]|nr:mechanosensitive ion channel family protein [Nitrosomonadales bacterium]